jgi:integrase
MTGKGTLAEKNGSWYVVLCITEDGKKRRKWVKLEAKTEAQAKTERNKIWADRENDTWIEPKNITFDECYDRWIAHLKNRPKPAGRRTVEEYKKIYRAHIKEPLGHIKVQKLTAKQVRELIESKESQFRARRTYDVINAILGLAYKDGDIGLKENVCRRLDPPKIEPVEHKTWNAKQCKIFLKAARFHRDYGVFLMAMTTGMRIGEVLGIRWQDIDLKNKQFKVNQKLEKKETGNSEIQTGDPKTKASKASLLMTDILAEELERVQQRQRFERNNYKEQYQKLDFIFTNTVGGPVVLEDLRKRVFNKIVKNINAEKELVPKIRIHDLRHSAATLLLSMGVPIEVIKRYLRHADLSATQIYAHDDNVDILEEATKKMNQALR